MTLRYVLDTDAVRYAIRGQGNVGARILEYKPSELCISSITLLNQPRTLLVTEAWRMPLLSMS